MDDKLILGESMCGKVFHSGYNEIMRSMDILMDISVSDPLYDIVDNLMNDSTASNEEMIDLILQKKSMVLEFNPDFNFSLLENNNE